MTGALHRPSPGCLSWKHFVFTPLHDLTAIAQDSDSAIYTYQQGTALCSMLALGLASPLCHVGLNR